MAVNQVQVGDEDAERRQDASGEDIVHERAESVANGARE
jgi:hypothetical protein